MVESTHEMASDGCVLDKENLLRTQKERTVSAVHFLNTSLKIHQ
jgi:hypothetical protein